MDELTMDQGTTISKPIAPEDIEAEMYITALYVMTEHLLLCDDSPWKREGPIRTLWLPWCGAGVPLRVVEVCLPFVLVEQPDGKHTTLDTRRYRLARLGQRYGKKASKRLRADVPPRTA